MDTPEGGFDALMQVTACNSTLKWRPIEKAHRIVVFVTDASPHIAGDGKVSLMSLLSSQGKSIKLQNRLALIIQNLNYHEIIKM